LPTHSFYWLRKRKRFDKIERALKKKRQTLVSVIFTCCDCFVPFYVKEDLFDHTNGKSG